MTGGADTPLTRGVFVRLTTDRFAEQGAPRGAEGLTLYHADEGSWRISCKGKYIDAYENEFEVTGPWLRPRGVTLPSLSGGWLAVEPFLDRHRMSDEILGSPVIERWGRQPEPSDFLGMLHLRLSDSGVGFPVLWDRQRQLKLVYFLDTPDRMTHRFPQEWRLGWPDQELQIEGLVTISDDRDSWSRKAGEVEVTLDNPGGDRRTVSGHLIIPAYTCKQASEWLVDLFPSVSADDLDYT